MFNESYLHPNMRHAPKLTEKLRESNAGVIAVQHCEVTLQKGLGEWITGSSHAWASAWYFGPQIQSLLVAGFVSQKPLPRLNEDDGGIRKAPVKRWHSNPD